MAHIRVIKKHWGGPPLEWHREIEKLRQTDSALSNTSQYKMWIPVVIILKLGYLDTKRYIKEISLTFIAGKTNWDMSNLTMTHP